MEILFDNDFMLFEEIIGHTEIKKQLIETIKGERISHAQLFNGPEGSGKLPLAIAYAQYVNCLDKQENDSCGKCRSCIKFQKLIHPDLHFVFPVATTAKVKTNPVSDNFIKEWRQRINENSYISLEQWYRLIGMENKQGSIQKDDSYQIIRKLSRKSYEAEYKVMVIWMAEKMNASAANKLLKIIEEPPAKTLFLLISENSEQIIKTILSRTQIIEIPKIDDDSLSKTLQTKHGIDKNQAKDLVRLANGNYIKAIDLIDLGDENKENFDFFTEMMRNCYSRKVLDLINLAERLAKTGRERQKRFFIYASRMIRENFVLNIANEYKNEIAYLHGQEAGFSEKFSKFITKDNVMPISQELDKARFHIERNGYANIVILDLCLKITQYLRLSRSVMLRRILKNAQPIIF